MSVNFMGLCAATGVLAPCLYGVSARASPRQRTTAPASSSTSSITASSRCFIAAGRSIVSISPMNEPERATIVISTRLLDLIGLGTKGLTHRMEIEDEACLYYAGLFSQRRPTAQGLKQLLEDYFEVPVSVEQFTGTWRRLPPAIAPSFATAEHSASGWAWAPLWATKFGISTAPSRCGSGPLSFERYQEFLPGARRMRELRAWLRFYANREFDFVIRAGAGARGDAAA